MAIAVVTQSSLTLTASEQTVGSAVASGKTVVLQADLTNMANGDAVTLNCYVKTAGTGGPAGVYFSQSFVDTQAGSPVYQSIPVCGPYSVEFKLVQPTGTGRAIPFVLMTID